ncbi:hypothetical protein EN866_34430 [Mesorhizobium sp. M2D.F.Ca.ET.223.01.1.1]|uniref:hypothetical protein n=1 Tax=Mesorhizobium sp. M2D.F.Ca.ET.223.01.1.1 TaxID=2563940 RepID=UPI00109298EF|nr:hypothetical protein [Mesorhizobium sp. M2D.F.Ca.ET.223.01.1.1]TGR83028.1 hypothetical protein EN866_34430 [Mesorhizobium sp. M2D.F.Ca.ET.223.01.1.1]TGT65296.1 hypothetical protein EN802_31955 [bacterium M00.F.Ca.ET.159.01.1.1]TGT79407.1 hypothetical protein EN800_31295 [bacterium M00.F.Ca.ET.157.01.1.1]
MLESFPQTSGNPDLTVSAYELAVRDVSSQAIIETCQRFISGRVEEQSMDFAPAPPRFGQEARRRQEDLSRKRSLPAPRYFPGPLAPFQIRQEKRRAEYADRQVIEANAPLDRFIALSRSKQLPVGAIWVACMGILGPKPQQQAAE